MVAVGRIETELSRWPIVVHRTIGSPGDPEVDAFIHRAEEILARRTTHVVIFDNLLADMPSAYMRDRSVTWLRANAGRMRGVCVGTGLVFSSAALRFLLSAVMLAASHPTPHRVCATLDEALAWGEQQIALARRQTPRR